MLTTYRTQGYLLRARRLTATATSSKSQTNNSNNPTSSCIGSKTFPAPAVRSGITTRHLQSAAAARPARAKPNAITIRPLSSFGSCAVPRTSKLKRLATSISAGIIWTREKPSPRSPWETAFYLAGRELSTRGSRGRYAGAGEASSVSSAAGEASANFGSIMTNSHVWTRHYNSSFGSSSSGGGGGGGGYCRQWFWTAAAVTAATAAATMATVPPASCNTDSSSSSAEVSWNGFVARGRGGGGYRERSWGTVTGGEFEQRSVRKGERAANPADERGGADDNTMFVGAEAGAAENVLRSLPSPDTEMRRVSEIGCGLTFSSGFGGEDDGNYRGPVGGDGEGPGRDDEGRDSTDDELAPIDRTSSSLKGTGSDRTGSERTGSSLGPRASTVGSISFFGGPRFEQGENAGGRGVRALSVASGGRVNIRAEGGVLGGGDSGSVEGAGKATPVAGRPLFTSAQAAKGHRSYMEDEYFLSADGSFSAVYDGHGGAMVSKYLRQNLYKQVLENLPPGVDVYDLPTMQQALKAAFKAVDDYVINQAPYQHQGSTAVAVVVHSDRDGKGSIISCNVGDSRAVLSRRGEALDLTEDHKPNAPAELERILSHNGKVHWFGFLDPEGGPMEGTGVYRINGNLAVARAIGDIDERPFVSGECEMRTIGMNPETDQFVILATDGLWDVMSSEEAVQYVHTVMGGAMGALREGDRGHGRAGGPSGGGERPAHMTLSDWTQRFADDRGMIRAAMMLRKKKMARYLTEEAIRRGSMDNTTVVVVWLQ